MIPAADFGRAATVTKGVSAAVGIEVGAEVKGRIRQPLILVGLIGERVGADLIFLQGGGKLKVGLLGLVILVKILGDRNQIVNPLPIC